jgi:hypothetical protein
VLSTGVVHGRPAEVETIVGRGLGSIVAASMTCLVGESGVVISHLVIMVIIVGRAHGRLWPVIETALILSWSYKNRVVGMSLAVLL